MQKQKEIKIILWIIALIALIGFYSKHIDFIVEASENDTAINVRLPDNPDKQELTAQDRVLITAQKKGFNNTEYLLNLIWCESRFDEYAYNLNKGHSLDLGIMQWNMHYHPEIGMECAMNIECAVSHAIDAINAGKQRMWVCDKLIK